MTVWKVNMIEARLPEIVSADYHVVEGGVLKFRNGRPSKGAYPVTVMAFAHGQWISVENTDVRATFGNSTLRKP